MPRSLLSIVAGWLALATAALLNAQERSMPAQQTPHALHKKITKVVRTQYLVFLPQDYQPKSSKRWPLMLFLHGAGERGSDLQLVTKHGPPKLVKHRPDFPFILVSPQCPAGQTWDNDVLLALLDEVLETYRVDPRRVYLTGLSMGGYGTWSLGLAHPERFAAIVPICGGGDPIKAFLGSRDHQQALRSLGVWAFHGAKDSVVSVQESERMVSALRRVGCQDVQLTVYPEANHDSWTQTYENPQLYDWLLAHQRK
jgi:predicted peptidase